MMFEHGLRAIAEAVASATRAPLEAVRRRGLARAIFFALAFDQGWTQTARLAVIGRCRPRRVRELVARVDAHALEVARLCLGDPRLRRLPARPPLDRKLRIHGE